MSIAWQNYILIVYHQIFIFIDAGYSQIQSLEHFNTNFSRRLFLCRGARMLLTKYINISEGLANGVFGSISTIQFETDENFPSVSDNTKVGANRTQISSLWTAERVSCQKLWSLATILSSEANFCLHGSSAARGHPEGSLVSLAKILQLSNPTWQWVVWRLLSCRILTNLSYVVAKM